jgi:hypothetical protein
MRLKLKSLEELFLSGVRVPSFMRSYFGKVWDFERVDGGYFEYTLPGEGMDGKWWFKEECIDKSWPVGYNDDIIKLFEEPL